MKIGIPRTGHVGMTLADAPSKTNQIIRVGR
jgi:hypothetical protein